MDRKVNNVPVYYFKTYVGAAVKAYRGKLMGIEAVQRVVARAVAELNQLDPSIGIPTSGTSVTSSNGRSSRPNRECKTSSKAMMSNIDMNLIKSRRLELENDIKEAQYILSAAGIYLPANLKI